MKIYLDVLQIAYLHKMFHIVLQVFVRLFDRHGLDSDTSSFISRGMHAFQIFPYKTFGFKYNPTRTWNFAHL